MADNGKEVPGTGSARKVVQVLLTFSEQRPRASVRDLAAEMGVTQATAYRYVALLRSLGLVEEGRRNTYQLTAKVMPMARAAQVVNDDARLARPVMEGLARRLGETIMLLSVSSDLAVCIERVESTRPMRFTFEPGHTLPLGRGASGKALLQLLPAPERARLLTDWPESSRRALERELEQIAEQGYAESFGEVDRGVWACSVPVRTGDRSPLVLSMAGPEGRISADERRDVVETVKGGARSIAEGLRQFALT